MPGQDPAAPNLQIAAGTEALDALALTQDFRTRVEALRSNVQKTFGEAPASFRQALRARANNPDTLIQALANLRDAAPSDAGEAAARVRRTAIAVSRLAGRRLAALQEALNAAPRDTDAYRNLEHDVYRVRTFSSTVRVVLSFGETPSFHVMASNRLLLLGRWGTGKTHSLCDIAKRRIAARLPTLLCLGQQLPDGVDPLEGVCHVTGLAATPQRLLRALQRLGEAVNGRALLIVDAINEGDRREWKRVLPGLRRRLGYYPNVALVVSCRQPFDDQLFNRRVRAHFVSVYHDGFAEREFDAQLSFFDYYDIPAPHFPLITEEFSRPLFLQLLCKAVARLSRQNQHRQLRQFASGQRGMTFLLESFVDHVGADIEDHFGLARGLCWKILKGHFVNPGGPIVGIAPAMAAKPSDTLTLPECLHAIEAFLTGKRIHQIARRLLRRMLADGLLAEDIRWTANGPLEVIRLRAPLCSCAAGRSQKIAKQGG